MNRVLVLACAIAGAQALAQVTPPPTLQLTPPPGVSQGELLYSTHCVGCHSTQVHWREKRLATNWKSLVEQVRRWQATANLGWGEEEIGAVANYLNALFYRFPAPTEKKIGTTSGEKRVARHD